MGDRTKTGAGYRVLPYPRMRRLVMDAGWMSQRRHMIHGLIEVDIAEIRALQADPERQVRAQSPVLRWFYYAPTFLRHLVYRVVEKNPQWRKQYSGTVGLTSVGMFGRGSGWGLSLPNHSLAVVLGGMAEKPGVVDGRIAIREYLNVTVSFDHDVIDGAPAARFTRRMKDLLEEGYRLIELARP